MNENIKKNQHFWHFITSTVYILLVLFGIFLLDIFNKIPQNVPVFDFFMITLATFRVTRLLVHDLVLDFIRDFFEDATHGLALSMRSLLHCPWCTGAWVALGLGLLYFLTPLAWPFIFIMAIAGFGTLLTILASMMMVSLDNNSKK